MPLLKFRQRQKLTPARLRQLFPVGAEREGFLPSQLPGLAAWFAADQQTYQDTGLSTPAVLDGDPVGGWFDLSGSGNHVTQATAANKGTLKLNIQNGRPAVLFDGTDDYLASAVSPITGSSGRSFFGVINNVANTSSNYIFDFSFTAPSNLNAFAITPEVGVRIKGANRLFTSGQLPNNNTAFVLLGVVYQAGADISTVAAYVNGTALAESSHTAGVPNTANGGLTIANGSLGGPMNMYAGEIVVYNRALTDAEVAQVNAYLKARWATP